MVADHVEDKQEEAQRNGERDQENEGIKGMVEQLKETFERKAKEESADINNSGKQGQRGAGLFSTAIRRNAETKVLASKHWRTQDREEAIKRERQ